VGAVAWDAVPPLGGGMGGGPAVAGQVEVQAPVTAASREDRVDAGQQVAVVDGVAMQEEHRSPGPELLELDVAVTDPTPRHGLMPVSRRERARGTGRSGRSPPGAVRTRSRSTRGRAPLPQSRT